MAGLPIKFGSTPGVIGAPPPSLGQHTREVLQELSMPDDRIAALEAAGIVECAPQTRAENTREDVA
jgi:crotonobetainyl-CoA:carnitine CoA-transferase CaiB-like acyl-CoA transferase